MSDVPGGPEWWQAADGRWHPPQPASSGWVKPAVIGATAALVVVVVAIVAVVTVVSRTAESAGRHEATESGDVGEPACDVDRVGLMMAEVPVTNRSSERSSYVIQVSFEAPDGSQISTAPALVSALEPGQSTTTRAQTLKRPPAGGEFTCRVADTNRFSEEG
ncbi:MAG TPA: hypothetical protein VFI47_12275 [Acidimicrobiales bacterium]|nr:hypothetical protein [Acidimicrobiales bacterium]